MAVALGGSCVALIVAGVQVANAQQPGSASADVLAKVCPPLDSKKIDTKGDPKTVTIPNEEAELPAGMVIVKYCVKAGSANQGDGPIEFNVSPGVTSKVLEYPGGKAISHYSFAWALAPTPTPTVTPTPDPESPTPTSSPEPESPTPTSSPEPEIAVSPASPQIPVPVDSDELAPDETFPVDIADPGAVATQEESAPVRPASPQQASVPTSVPAGGGAASNQR